MQLTTFISPFGRFCYKRLPMGINIGPEVFQLRMEKVLRGLRGCAVIMDDILVWGSSKQEHDKNLRAVCDNLKQSGLMLNIEKSQICKCEVDFFGHVIRVGGIRPGPEKVRAIAKMAPPRDITELCSLCGMLNHLSKFTPGLPSVIKPITNLMKSDVAYVWGQPQQSAFEAAKDLVKNVPSLQYFRFGCEVVVSADASSYGLGAALLQWEGDKLVPTAFASRSLTKAERRYAKIEKECLAAVWACKKFRKYLEGLPEFQLWTDHKPLVPLISKKALDQAPVRCQRLLIRLLRFSPVVSHKPGKELVITDALSQNPLHQTEHEMADEVAIHVYSIFSQLPVTQNQMSLIHQ